MKFLFTLFTAALFLTGCAPSATVDTSTWENYENEYYRFALSFPEDYSTCMNAYCINEIPADALSTLTVLNASGATVLSVQPYKNDLGMSAMAYGEKAAEDNEGITNAGATTFAGQEAFAFTTAGDFYEPGGARGITEDGHISLLYDADATEIPFVEVNGSSRVIYTDYNGYFYRITYREIGEEIEAMVQSFKFL
jgi:hypothetical protein